MRHRPARQPAPRCGARRIVLLASLLAVQGCGGSAEISVGSGGGAGRPEAITAATGLAFPWGLAFLPSGDMLVTEKPGRLRLVGAKGSVSEPIAGVPAVSFAGQGGLLDVAIDPAFANNRRIYLSYAEASGGVKGTAVARAVLAADGRSLGNLEVIFRQQPKVDGNGHFGGRLAFAPDGKLFVTLGERQKDGDRGGATQESQNLASHLGKVVRINGDGSVPADNPFVATAGAAPEVWSYGHRNVQGAAIHPVSGELWTVEHGPQGGDEVNITRRGRNYGWPLVSYGCNYGDPVGNCTPVGGASTAPGIEAPLTWWVPTSIAPSGMAFYTASRIPEWRGSLFVGALAGQGLWRLDIDGETVRSRELLLRSLGKRIRDVRQGPDGWLYLLTDEASGSVLRVER